MHESNKVNNIEIKDSNVSFFDIYNKEYFPNEYENEIKQANILLLPYESFRDYSKPIFPEGTYDFFEYLQEANKSNVVSDICISDEDYIELELHADLITLPLLIVEYAVFPIVTGLISSYLWNKMNIRKNNLKVKVDMTVTEGEKSKHITYEGDANKFAETLESAKNNFFNE